MITEVDDAARYEDRAPVVRHNFGRAEAQQAEVDEDSSRGLKTQEDRGHKMVGTLWTRMNRAYCLLACLYSEYEQHQEMLENSSASPSSRDIFSLERVFKS